MASNAYEYFIGRENARMVEALEKNHDISRCMMGLLEQLVNYANHKGVGIDKVRMRDAFVLPTDDGDAQVRMTFYVVPDA